MKVTEKKLDDGRILLEAVASTAEVSHALTAAQYRFAQQMGVQPTPGMSVEQAVEKQLGIKDLDAIVQQQAVEYLVPFAIDKRNITPAFPALPKAAGPLKRGQTFSFEVRVTPKPDYELKSYEPVSITVPPFEIEQAEVEEQIAQIAESYAEFVSDEPHPVAKGDGFLLALEAFQNGEKMDNLSTEGRTYLTGMGLMPEDFEKHLIGMNVGETKSFSFDLPGMNADDKGDIAFRNHFGYGRMGQLVNTTGRNDIVQAKVANDGTYLYFYVKTASDITPYKDKNWMRLFINVIGSDKPNWEHFQYMINGEVTDETTTSLAVCRGNWNWETQQEISYRVEGSEMELAIPMASLGIKNVRDFKIDFKWIDNAVSKGDIQECLTDGDAAPNGRFRYRYQFKK